MGAFATDDEASTQVAPNERPVHDDQISSLYFSSCKKQDKSLIFQRGSMEVTSLGRNVTRYRRRRSTVENLIK
jgi:hypothetical protein